MEPCQESPSKVYLLPKDIKELTREYGASSRQVILVLCPKCGGKVSRKVRDCFRNPQRCPCCAGKIIISGINDIATRLPQLVDRWDEDKNSKSPTELGISARAYFSCSQCKQSTLRMASAVAAFPQSCSVCSGKIVIEGINDLATIHPWLATEWSPKNALQPHQVTAGSGRKVLWNCSRCNHQWNAQIGARAHLENGCPACAGQVVRQRINYSSNIAEIENNSIQATPSLLTQWDWVKNISHPHTVCLGSNTLCYWVCSQGHHYSRTPNASWNSIRATVRKCPHCRSLWESFGSVELTQFLKDKRFKVINESGLPLGGNRRVDLLLPQQKIALEYNGEYWHSSEVILPKYGITAQEFHRRRMDDSLARGFKLGYVWSGDWTQRREEVEQELLTFILTQEKGPLLSRLHSGRQYSKSEVTALRRKFNVGRTPKPEPKYLKVCHSNIEVITQLASSVHHSYDDIASQLNVAPSSLKRFIQQEKIPYQRKLFSKVELEQLNSYPNGSNFDSIVLTSQCRPA